MSESVLHRYRTALAKLSFGKRVGTHIYFHKVAINELPDELMGLVSLAQSEADNIGFEFSVIKMGLKTPSISILNYPAFNHQAFPRLHQSAKLDLQTHQLKTIDFRESKNPPILHRKELLLPVGHKNHDKFALLTQQAESLGLLNDKSSIGLLKGWRKVLKANGVKIIGHKLHHNSESTCARPKKSAEIQRHRTAISRSYLSSPLQLLEKYGYLNGEYSIFDFGCGKGEDLELLSIKGVQATGWDPHFFPKNEREAADLVNLGFVINVIEDPKERLEALKASFSLANRFLVVSAMRHTPQRLADCVAHGDGTLSRLNTFQKYYAPDELQNYVRSSLKAPVVPISQETVLAFKNEEELNRFFARKAGVRRHYSQGSRRLAEQLFLLDEGARDLLIEFWIRCIELGREPLPEELSEAADVLQIGLSPKKALQFMVEKFGDHELTLATEQRRQDLLVEFALGFFQKRSFFKYLSSDVKKDIECFFSNYSQLRKLASELLFSIAEKQKLLDACIDATSDDIGYLFGEHSLQLHVESVPSLSPILRVYVGCAERLLGGMGPAELVKIHIQSGKVTFMHFDDFEGRPIPNLLERIKVNLWSRTIDYFDYVGPFTPQPLLMKSLFLDPESDLRSKQETFDCEVMKAGLYDPANPHPTLAELNSQFRAKGCSVGNYRLDFN